MRINLSAFIFTGQISNGDATVCLAGFFERFYAKGDEL